METALAVLVALLARDVLLTGGRWAIRAFERYMVGRAFAGPAGRGRHLRGRHLAHDLRRRFAP